jgi:hypothetical protein
VSADPEPYEPVGHFDGQRAVLKPYSDRPEAPDLLEVKRWVTGVFLQSRVGLVGDVLDV